MIVMLYLSVVLNTNKDFNYKNIHSCTLIYKKLSATNAKKY
jgi:hypothetical protein